jgi:hypothetical protein
MLLPVDGHAAQWSTAWTSDRIRASLSASPVEAVRALIAFTGVKMTSRGRSRSSAVMHLGTRTVLAVAVFAASMVPINSWSQVSKKRKVAAPSVKDDDKTVETEVPQPPDTKSTNKNRVDMTVYGIPLGTPLAKCVDPCEGSESHDRFSPTDNPRVWCQEQIKKQKSKPERSCFDPVAIGPGHTNVLIHLKAPNGEWIPNWFGDLRNGKLVGVATNIVDDDTIGELVTKYGKATRARTLRFQNGYGAVVERPDREWNLPGLHVHLTVEGVGTDPTPLLTIELESAYKAGQEQEDGERSKKPKL